MLKIFQAFLCCFILLGSEKAFAQNIPYQGIPLYYWQQQSFVNFGDYISLKLVERIVNTPVKVHKNFPWNKYVKLIAVGSMMSFAKDGDVIWGTGINGKLLDKKHYPFTHLDIRSVRGPLTRAYLKENLGIIAPEIYGDPALLIPYLFPEFKKKKNPSRPYIIIPHFTENKLFPKNECPQVVYPTEPWDEIIRQILDSEFVISSSLHGLIIADAFGIPCRMLKITDTEPLFKYQDYYFGTNRPNFTFATSIEEALQIGPEAPLFCDLQKLYNAFPFDYWPNASFARPNFLIKTMDVKK